ncbi:glycosyl hydrolase family 18 protein [Sphingomonas parva]|nr:glycosyl hydrolase family 18 protein [Sphingomonas parva]
MSLAVAAVSTLASPAALAEPARSVTIGYIPAFRGVDAAIGRSDLSQYTHLNIAFVNPDKDGRIAGKARFTCAADGEDRMLSGDAVRALVGRAHQGGSKILISLGGGAIPECSGDWEALLRPERRAKVVKSLIEAVERYGLDGIDVDIEGALLTKIDQAGNFTPFVAELSRALKARGKLLTCATASYEGGMVPTSSIPYFDLVAIMTYDAIGPSWGEAGDEHSTVAQARKDIQLWRDRGVAQERLILGVPFYGYGYGRYKPNWAFREIEAAYPGAATLTDVIGSRCAGCSYITFNGLPTLIEKSRLARERTGGIMVWEISQDSDDQKLIRAVNKALTGAAE